MLGIKFTDRTFRFASLLNLHDGLRLTAAGAGLIPFTSMDRGVIRPDGIAALIEVLDRALDREGVERSEATVVLDGRIVVRTHFPLQAGSIPGEDDLRKQVEWEIGTRFGGVKPDPDLHVAWTRQPGSDRTEVVDAWGIPRTILEGYRTVVEGVGCQVAGWDCDPWAMTRFVRLCAAAEDAATIAAVHVEAESLEIAMIRGNDSAGATSLRRDSSEGVEGQWNSDEPDAVAAEIHRCLEALSRRWFPGDPIADDRVERVWFTGSVENPDSLLAALVRTLKTRVEMIDIPGLIELDSSLAASPLIESNLGSFALCIGGVLADTRP